MSAILLAITGWSPESWEKRFRARAPGHEFRVWPDRVGNPEAISYICAWKPPHGLLATFPNVKAVFSLGAGVDHLTGDSSLPDIPIVRIVDPDLTARMTEYVVLHVLMAHRGQRLYDRQQRERVWRDRPQPAAREVTVGVMGLGVMGRDSADALYRLGFNLVGWSRTPKSLPGVEAFFGAEGLERFLSRTEILVCLLPHTPATEGILSLGLFRKLKRDGALGGAFLINAGRGRLQNDDDIVAALNENSLAGATLDVFPAEPLPQTSPLWDHPKVTVTPHNAAASAPNALVDYVLDQINAFERGEPLQNAIDRSTGY